VNLIVAQLLNKFPTFYVGWKFITMLKIKTILITFFDKEVASHKEFVPEGQTVNSAFYVEVIGRLSKRISRVRSQFRAQDSWCCTTMLTPILHW
jgi:hypothetical protein